VNEEARGLGQRNWDTFGIQNLLTDAGMSPMKFVPSGSRGSRSPMVVPSTPCSMSRAWVITTGLFST
jgi:hypothetical protein